MDNTPFKSNPIVFNLAAKNNNIIGELLDNITKSQTNSNYKSWYTNLKSIKLTAISSFDTDERQLLKNKEKKIEIYFKHKKEEGIHCPKKNSIFNNALNLKLSEEIENYEIELKDLLKAKGYMNPNNENKFNRD